MPAPKVTMLPTPDSTVSKADILPVTQINDIRITTRATIQFVVTTSASQNIIAGTSLQQVVAGVAV